MFRHISFQHILCLGGRSQEMELLVIWISSITIVFGLEATPNGSQGKLLTPNSEITPHRLGILYGTPGIGSEFPACKTNSLSAVLFLWPSYSFLGSWTRWLTYQYVKWTKVPFPCIPIKTNCFQSLEYMSFSLVWEDIIICLLTTQCSFFYFAFSWEWV